MGCEVVCWAEPTVVIGLWLVKERELSGEFSPSDKRWATPNSSSSHNNQWSKSTTQSSCIVSTVGAPAGSSAEIQPPSWRNQNNRFFPSNFPICGTIPGSCIFLIFLQYFRFFYPSQYPAGVLVTHPIQPLHSKLIFHHSWPKFSAPHPTSKCISSTQKMSIFKNSTQTLLRLISKTQE